MCGDFSPHLVPLLSNPSIINIRENMYQKELGSQNQGARPFSYLIAAHISLFFLKENKNPMIMFAIFDS